jgi:hypothetical protein
MLGRLAEWATREAWRHPVLVIVRLLWLLMSEVQGQWPEAALRFAAYEAVMRERVRLSKLVTLPFIEGDRVRVRRDGSGPGTVLLVQSRMVVPGAPRFGEAIACMVQFDSNLTTTVWFLAGELEYDRGQDG